MKTKSAKARPRGFRTKLWGGVRTGIRKGVSSFIWICEIIIPVSFLVALLQWSGWLYRADSLLNPLMGLINLPSEAALPIISGMVINLYAAIAVMTVLPFTTGQMTLIAVFTLIAHNLVVEGIIQHRSGISIVKITLVRIGAAIITALVVSHFLGDTTASIAAPAGLAVQFSLIEALKTWGLNMLHLLLKVFLIIMTIMVALESLRQLGWMDYLFDLFRPFMKVLGLSNRTTTLWVTAVIFGLMYGGAVIVEEVRQGDLTKAELERLHISIGINHSMLEDPVLFLALGLNGVWLWVPKLIMAAITVQVFQVASHLKRRVSSRASR